MAMANAAGSSPSSRRQAHHAAARPGLAFVRAMANCHSFRLVILRFVFRSPVRSLSELAVARAHFQALSRRILTRLDDLPLSIGLTNVAGLLFT
jgi:hypothetical protein